MRVGMGWLRRAKFLRKRIGSLLMEALIGLRRRSHKLVLNMQRHILWMLWRASERQPLMRRKGEVGWRWHAVHPRRVGMVLAMWAPRLRWCVHDLFKWSLRQG
jgi:hypothetical protein